MARIRQNILTTSSSYSSAPKVQPCQATTAKGVEDVLAAEADDEAIVAAVAADVEVESKAEATLDAVEEEEDTDSVDVEDAAGSAGNARCNTARCMFALKR
jgi:hypothetical protein